VAVGSQSSSSFAVLGVPEEYELDLADVERRYRSRSREVHPDRFATAPAAERLRSLREATALNDAYRTLRSPVARAEHLLALRGAPLSAREPVAQEFLMEILELREALAEARAAGDEERVRALHGDVQRRHAAALGALGALFARGALDDVKRQLVAARYFQRFLDEVEGTEEAA